MKVLVKNGGHRNPLLAALERAKVGKPDKHGRGIWVNPVPDRAKFLAFCKRTCPGLHTGNDGKTLLYVYNGTFDTSDAPEEHFYVYGTCRSNNVGVQDFDRVLLNSPQAGQKKRRNAA